jgi:plastocyanin domain-containing protein
MGTWTLTDWTVLAAALAAIGWVNWYFFAAGRSRALAAASAGGMQEVTIAVQGGYEPRTVQVKAGQPVRLVFDRQETSSCSEEVVIPDFGIRRFLPAFEQTAIEITPTAPGEYEFTCGMSMLRGRIVAE